MVWQANSSFLEATAILAFTFRVVKPICEKKQSICEYYSVLTSLANVLQEGTPDPALMHFRRRVGYILVWNTLYSFSMADLVPGPPQSSTCRHPGSLWPIALSH